MFGLCHVSVEDHRGFDASIARLTRLTRAIFCYNVSDEAASAASCEMLSSHLAAKKRRVVCGPRRPAQTA